MYACIYACICIYIYICLCIHLSYKSSDALELYYNSVASAAPPQIDTVH